MKRALYSHSRIFAIVTVIPLIAAFPFTVAMIGRGQFYTILFLSITSYTLFSLLMIRSQKFFPPWLAVFSLLLLLSIEDCRRVERSKQEFHLSEKQKSCNHSSIEENQEAWVAASGPLATLPPDPGLDGKLTILGIDSDNDGVRDDMQRKITFVFPIDPFKRASAMFAAKTMTLKLTKYLTDKTVTYHELGFESSLMEIAVTKMLDSGADDTYPLPKILALFENTPERFKENRSISTIYHGQRLPHTDFAIFKDSCEQLFQDTFILEQNRQK